MFFIPAFLPRPMKQTKRSFFERMNYLDNAYKVGIVINVAFLVAELIAGFVLNSVALFSDVWHNVSDVFALFFSMVAFRLMHKEPNERFTFGYKKSTIHVSLVNACVLFVAIGAVVMRSIEKLIHPSPVEGGYVAWIAAIGIGVNVLTLWMFYRHRKRDLNVDGVFLHVAADTLVSLGVVLAGVIISFTDLYVLDPVIALFNSGFILVSAVRHISESLRLALDGVPEGLDPRTVRETIMAREPEVVDIHYIHLWAVSTVENAFTAHVVVSTPHVGADLKRRIKHHLAELNITHANLEFEHPGEECEYAAVRYDEPEVRG